MSTTDVSDLLGRLQGDLLPRLAHDVVRRYLGPLTEKMKLFVAILEMAPLDGLLRTSPGWPGRPLSERLPLARAFIAKAVLAIPTTTLLIERLLSDTTLRRLCGWERRCGVPSESTFSRAYGEFAALELPARVPECCGRSADRAPAKGPAGRSRGSRCDLARGARGTGQGRARETLAQAAPA